MPHNFNGIPDNALCYNIAQQHPIEDSVHDVSSIERSRISHDFIPEKVPCQIFLPQQCTTEDPPDDVEKLAIDHSSPGFVCTAQMFNRENVIVSFPVETTNSASRINVSENKH